MARPYFLRPLTRHLLGLALTLFGLSAGAATFTVTNLNTMSDRLLAPPLTKKRENQNRAGWVFRSQAPACAGSRGKPSSPCR